MSDKIEFTRNYSDLSTNQGFQFEFHCDRCGTGHRTRFQATTLGAVSGALDVANSLFGGLFGRAADVSERMRSASWEKAHDEAFAQAVAELRPDFAQCPHCSGWVCKKQCWNDERGLCKNCAPDIGVEKSAAQARRTVDEVWSGAQVADEDKGMIAPESWKDKARATCPNCNAPLAGGAKFCPECGTKIKAEAFCTECGAKLAPGAKFCAECGAKAPSG